MTKSEYRQELNKKIQKEINKQIKNNNSRIQITQNEDKLDMLMMLDVILNELKEKIDDIMK